MTSLSVMGVGKIGGEIAFLASLAGVADTLNLHDTYRPLLHAQIQDIKHTGLDIRVSTDPSEIRDADIFVFSAGIPRNPTIRTRADLLEANIPVADICAKYLEGFDGILITVTNPMDANNYYLCKKTGLDRSRCIGFGGMLDSARFGVLLKERGIAGEPWVLGEHGDHQVPLFSKLPATVPVSERDEILRDLRASSMSVIKGKGGTVFGPAFHILQLIYAIVQDKKAILPCSCVLEGEYGFSECSLGVPARIGKNGMEEIVEWRLSDWEREQFGLGAAFVQKLCRKTHDQ
jgi:malate dehydrogenase